MRIGIQLLILLFSTIDSCPNKELLDTQVVKVLDEKFWDFDKDGIDEKIVVYETNDSTEFGNIREIIIQKKTDDKWSDWHKSRNAILKNEEGGMMGDPFQGIEIENDTLKIEFFGGSSWKWSYVDKYQFLNNQFRLVGYTSTYFKLCEYWETDDINFLTGKVISKKEYEKCINDEQEIYKKENETFIKDGLTIYLQNRNTNEIIIRTPKYNREIYVSQK